MNLATWNKASLAKLIGGITKPQQIIVGTKEKWCMLKIYSRRGLLKDPLGCGKGTRNTLSREVTLGSWEKKSTKIRAESYDNGILAENTKLVASNSFYPQKTRGTRGHKQVTYAIATEAIYKMWTARNTDIFLNQRCPYRLNFNKSRSILYRECYS
ncbi:hypothetical protein Cgig2_028420 [Carnegiea gigantea]|uniref:Uncharacterized protein n=1 Tax=Carnegiea gigantea TaxID=171969 RepID=A0A9Q1JEJ0_9CARY|nr:hypothetical protein Cgig2_028420 [Carnegiea gigantea]